MYMCNTCLSIWNLCTDLTDFCLVSLFRVLAKDDNFGWAHDITWDHMTSLEITWHHLRSHDITWDHMTSGSKGKSYCIKLLYLYLKISGFPCTIPAPPLPPREWCTMYLLILLDDLHGCMYAYEVTQLTLECGLAYFLIFDNLWVEWNYYA